MTDSLIEGQHGHFLMVPLIPHGMPDKDFLQQKMSERSERSRD